VDSSDEDSNETSSGGRDLDLDSGDEALFEVDAMEATPTGEEVRDDKEKRVDDDSDSDDNNHETCIQQSFNEHKMTVHSIAGRAMISMPWCYEHDSFSTFPFPRSPNRRANLDR
jgi:hypothetical protein